jgi:hypothetical protein
MQADPSDAQAAVDWAVSQLPALESRFSDWINDSCALVVEPHPEMGKNLIKLSLKERLPPTFNAEVGAITNSIRSSLDVICKVVARRYSVLGHIKVYFPIAPTAADWAARTNFKGSEFIKALPADASQIFESLKPYPGGNDTLIALHELDNLRKHSRLIDVRIDPVAVVVSTPSVEFPTRWVFENDAVIAWMALGEEKGQLEAPLQIVFDEATLFPNHPVVPTLSDLARFAESIINLFAGGGATHNAPPAPACRPESQGDGPALSR